jgi:ABC-type glutathione transport system ATPase component
MSLYSINKNFRAVPPPRPGAEPASAAGPPAARSRPPRRPARPTGKADEADGPTERALGVAEMFGLGLDESYEVVLYDGLRVDVRPGDVVFVTGPSGSGKSVLLRCLVEAMRAAEPAARIVDLAEAAPPAGVPVIEGLPAEFEESLRLASTAGLADAFVLLRPPEELSDGQRWRLRLAHALARLCEPPAEAGGHVRPSSSARRRGTCPAASAAGSKGVGHPPPESMRVLVADEFASTLDRLCARAVAYRLRRLADREGVTVLAASAHDDLIEDLAPDVLIRKEAGASVEVWYSNAERRRQNAEREANSKRQTTRTKARRFRRTAPQNPERRRQNAEQERQTAKGKRQ